jgi:uncharacterized protein YcbK (DUF882 family)
MHFKHDWPIILLILISLMIIQACCSLPLEAPCPYRNRYHEDQQDQQKQFKKLKPQKDDHKSKAKAEDQDQVALKGQNLLDGLHPELIAKILRLDALCKKEKIEIILISGYRPYEKKEKPKKNQVLASWHMFGLAFDINLSKYGSDMDQAIKNYQDDRETWEKIGKYAKQLGLTWGLKWGLPEVFHFEAHGDYPDAIRSDTFNQIKKIVNNDPLNQYQELWKHVKFNEISDEI